MLELINGMEHDHLTYRRSLPGGGRAVQIGLTAAGEAMVSKCEKRTAAIEKEMLSALNITQRTALRGALAICVGTIEGRHKTPRSIRNQRIETTRRAPRIAWRLELPPEAVAQLNGAPSPL